MKRVLQFVAQGLLYVPLMAIIGHFSTQPPFTSLPPDQALVRLSFTHAGDRLRPCRSRSPEELAKLAPNMRAGEDCPRERVDLRIEFEVDGQVIYSASVPPAGLQRDGAATVYRRLAVPAGTHRVVVRLADGPDRNFNYVTERSVMLAPGGALLIDFNPARGGFLFRS